MSKQPEHQQEIDEDAGVGDYEDPSDDFDVDFERTVDTDFDDAWLKDPDAEEDEDEDD